MIPLSAKGKIERRRWIACLIILSLISLALASCDGESTPETPTTAPTLTAAAPSATATSTAATAPQSQPTPTDEVESGETPLAATESVPAETSCGVILPLVASDIVEPTSRIDRGLVDSSKVPAAAQPALERILADPSSVGLVAFEVGSEESGIYFNADTAMPLASVAKIINLVAYANAVEVGLIDPAERIPFSDIEATYLPGSDLGAHRAARAELEQQGFLIGEDPTVPMEEIPWMMMRHSSNAASDYLQLRIGQETIEQTIIDLQMDSHTAPCPFLGQFLTMSSSVGSGNARVNVTEYVENPEKYGIDVMELTERYVSDPQFRDEIGYWRASIQAQRMFAEELNAKASARDYAALLKRISSGELGSDYANFLVRRAIEWPMIYLVNQELFSSVGYKSGSLPGVLNSAYYATRLEDGAQVVVVLFFHDLPMSTYRQWRRTLPHDEFARWLLSDPSAIETFRMWMSEN